MLFNSPTFLFLFLPMVWAGYRWLRRRHSGQAALRWLLAASIVFYGAWDWRYLGLLGPLALFNFAWALRLPVARPGRARTRRLAVGVTVNLGVLAYFKYAGFFLDNLRPLLGETVPVLHIILPLGISFFTFQKIAYLVDVSRGMPPERSFARYALFVSFFPQLIAGPIVHYREIAPSFDRVASQRPNFPGDLAIGLSIFIGGLAKKVLLADSLAPYADIAFNAAAQGQPLPTLQAWVGALCYAFQLYFDFSGYSDMAVGLGRMFGIDLPFNFHSPYKAESPRDFWHRWHITLSSFLRDYLYIPLGGNRHGPIRTGVNLIVTMTLGGFWHGANWTFVAWGLYHGALLIGQRLAQPLLPARVPRAIAIAATFVLVLMGWVMFRSDSITTAWRFYRAMFTFAAVPDAVPALAFGWLGIAALVAWALPAMCEFFAAESPLRPPRAVPGEQRWRWRPAASIAIPCALLLGASLLTMNRVSPFLYFQF